MTGKLGRRHRPADLCHGFFSYAYIALSAGMGAIILFAMVQITMLGWGLLRGERLSLACSGSGLPWLLVAALIWLVSPSLEAPPALGRRRHGARGHRPGACLFSARTNGAGGSDRCATAGNFLRASLLALPMLAAGTLVTHAGAASANSDGVLIAVISGAITSGLGYVIWYVRW